MFNPVDNIVLSNLDMDVKSKEGAYVFLSVILEFCLTNLVVQSSYSS